MSKISATIVADSISPQGHRIVSILGVIPRIVLSELNTHRMFCLSGDTILDFDLPAGAHKNRGYKRVFNMSLAEFADKWHNGAAPRPNNGDTGYNRQDIKYRLRKMKIRQYDETTGLIETSTIKNCFISGEKEVFEIATWNDSKVKASKDHLFLTSRGWIKLEDIKVGKDYLIVQGYGKREEELVDPIRLKKIDGKWKQTWNRKIKAILLERQNNTCAKCPSKSPTDVHHIVPTYQDPTLAFEETNVELLCRDCHDKEHKVQGWQGGTYLYGKPELVESIISKGVEQTYDLEIEGEFANFLANKIVVHNSRNSASSRAIPFKRMVEMVKEDPFIPIAWQKEHTGMQGVEYLDEGLSKIAEAQWRLAAAQACENTLKLTSELYGVQATKQIANRLLEPFMWHTVLISFTEIQNFFDLRCPSYEIDLDNLNNLK